MTTIEEQFKDWFESDAMPVEMLCPHDETRPAYRVADLKTILQELDSTLPEFKWLQICGPTLIAHGYDHRPQWGGVLKGKREQLVVKTNWATQRPQYIQMAKKLQVHGAGLITDGDTLVYLKMMGSRAAVRANWASAKGGGRRVWLGRERVSLGKEEHHTFQQPLPCGWDEMILLHKQASLLSSHGDEPFYLIDDGTAPYPKEQFMAQMGRGIYIPLQPHWADYLWLHGRLQDLITPLNDNCIAVTGWRIEVGRPWEGIVCEGVQSGALQFEETTTDQAIS